jgi:pseudaminic acid synthase
VKGRDSSRSLYVIDDVKKGQIISEKNVRSIRPGFGLHPKYLPQVLGKRFKDDIEKGTRFSLDLME